MRRAVLLALCAVRLAAGEPDGWSLRADGDGERIAWQGRDLALAPGAGFAVTWGDEAPPATAAWLRTARRWDAAAGCLEREHRLEGTAVTARETWILEPYRLTRRLVLRNAPGGAALRFLAVRQDWRLPAAGRFLFPAGSKGLGARFDPARQGDLAGLAAGRAIDAAERGNAPLLIAPDPATTLLFLGRGADDLPTTRLQRAGDGVAVEQGGEACGWLEPGGEQAFDAVSLDRADAPLEDALTWAVRRWHRDHGVRPPSDRPAWLRRAVAYSYHPAGSMGSRLQDVGGFAAAAEELPPLLTGLGVDLVWFLPLEEPWIYRPRDYDRWMPGLGSETEHLELLARLRARGIRVWQDLVIHGGTPAFAQARGDSPWSLLVQRDGGVPGYWCCDFLDPAWQTAIAGVATRRMQRYRLDGLRLDAAKGNLQPNWRRAGFPAAAPAGVDAAWWEQARTAAGGVPPLPYARASLGQRQGGLSVTARIRAAVKAANPDAAILAEVGEGVFAPAADVLYDATFTHELLFTLRERPHDFAAGLMRRLHEQACSDPDGLLRLRAIDTQDSTHALGLDGLGATRALYAIALLLDGLPLLHQDSDALLGAHLARLIALRRAVPALTGTRSRYPLGAVPATVFAVWRQEDGGDRPGCLALVNCAATGQRLPLALPAAAGGWHDAVSGRAIAVDDPAIVLAPWQHAVLVPGPAPAAAPAPTPAPVPADPLIQRDGDALAVRTAAYRARIAADGRLLELADGDGRPLLASAAPLGAAWTTTIADGLRSERTAADGATLALTWRALPDRLELHLQGDRLPEGAGVLLTGAEVAGWSADTVEGPIDDLAVPRHRHGRIDPAAGITPLWRQDDPRIRWRHETQPLAPWSPVIRLRRADGAGLAIRLLAADTLPVDELRLLDAWQGTPGWHLAVLARQSTPAGAARGGSRRFALAVEPLAAGTGAGTPTATALELPDGLRLEHDSLAWRLSNRHYRLDLQRAGGAIAGLWAAGRDEPVMAAGEVVADRGFGRAESPRPRYGSPAMDPETGVRLERDGGRLTLRFHARFRDGGAWPSIDPPLWGAAAYTVDGSDAIGVELGWMSEGPARLPLLARLRHSLRLPAAARWRCWRDGAELPTATRHGGDRLPQAIDLLDAGGRPLLRLEDLAWDAPAPPAAIAFADRRLRVAWLDGPAPALAPGAWHRLRFTLRTRPGAAP